MYIFLYIHKIKKTHKKIHKTKRSLTQFGNELQIFHNPSIENLKTLYNKTSKLLEDSQEQNVLPNSI